MTCKYKRFIVFFFNQQTVIYIQKRFNKRGNYCLDIFQYFLYYMHARNLFDIKNYLCHLSVHFIILTIEPLEPTFWLAMDERKDFWPKQKIVLERKPEVGQTIKVHT